MAGSTAKPRGLAVLYSLKYLVRQGGDQSRHYCHWQYDDLFNHAIKLV